MKIIYLMLGLAIAACGLGLFSGWCIWDEDCEDWITVEQYQTDMNDFYNSGLDAGSSITPSGESEYTYKIEISDATKVVEMLADLCQVDGCSDGECYEYGHCQNVLFRQVEYKDWANERGYYKLTEDQIQLLKDNCKWNYCDDKKRGPHER